MKQTIIKRDGKPNIDKDTLWSWVITYTSGFKDGTLFEWEIKRRIKRKKDPQRAHYFAGILPKFMEAVGYNPPESLDVHRFLKITYFEPQSHLLEKYGVTPITKDKHGYHHNVPRLFSKKSQIPIEIRAKFMAWVTQIAAEYGAEF